jgi:hypothetical protein
MSIKPGQLVEGAELVCTRSKNELFIVGDVYTIDALIGKDEIRINSRVCTTYWGIDCICRSTSKYKDWHTQFELKQKENSMPITTSEEIAKLQALIAELELRRTVEQSVAPVNISFKDTGELAVALASGRTFLTPNDLILSCDVTREGSPFICAISPTDYNTTMDHTWDYFKDLREIPSKFIPEPVPWYMSATDFKVKCYVSDKDENPGPGGGRDTIGQYEPGSSYPFIGSCAWKYAVPVNNTTRGV